MEVTIVPPPDISEPSPISLRTRARARWGADAGYLQSEAGYIDARPTTDRSTKTSCDARPDHTFGSMEQISHFRRGQRQRSLSAGAELDHHRRLLLYFRLGRFAPNRSTLRPS